MKTALVLLALLLLVTPLVAREVPVSEGTLGTPPGWREEPSISAGGDGYLVAWVDSRSNSQELFVTRLDEAGAPRDRHGISLGRSHHFTRPRVIWNGEAWLVFWSDENQRLVMSRVETSGIASERREISYFAPPEKGRWAVTNGSVIVIAHGGSSWSNADNAMVFATVLAMNGDVISSRIVDNRRSDTLTATALDNGFVIGWHFTPLGQPFEQFAVRLDSNGAPIDATPRSLGHAQAQMELMRNGDALLLVGANFSEAGWQYFSQAVSRDLVPSTRFALPMATINDRVVFAEDDSDGRAIVVVKEHTESASSFTAIRFDDQGRESSRKLFLSSSDALTDIALVHTGGVFTAAWMTHDVLEAMVRLDGARFDASFDQLTPPRELTATPTLESRSRVAAGANEVLIATRDHRGVHLRQFTYNGVRLEGEITLTDVYDGVPELVFDGTNYVVAYIATSQHEIVVRFVQPRGELLGDEVRIPSGIYPDEVALARGASSTLVAWHGFSEGVYAASIEGTRIARAPRSVATDVPASLKAAWNGEHFLLAWHRGIWSWDVYIYASAVGLRLEEDLTSADAEPRVIAQYETTYAPVSDLVARGSEWLFAFEHRLNIDIVRIDANANVIGSSYLTNAYEPRLASDGNNASIAWTSRGTNVLRAARLNADGSPSNAWTTIVAPAPGLFNFGFTTDLAMRGDQMILVYSRRALELGSIPRAFVTFDDEGNAPPRRRSVR